MQIYANAPPPEWHRWRAQPSTRLYRRHPMLVRVTSALADRHQNWTRMVRQVFPSSSTRQHGLHRDCQNQCDPAEGRGSLQSIQNEAARLITGTRRCDHITISVTKIALAINSRKDWIQGRLSRLQVVGQSGTGLLDWWLSSHFRVSPVCRLQNLYCTKNIQPFRWPKFLSFGPHLWNTLKVKVHRFIFRAFVQSTSSPPSRWSQWILGPDFNPSRSWYSFYRQLEARVELACPGIWTQALEINLLITRRWPSLTIRPRWQTHYPRTSNKLA